MLCILLGYFGGTQNYVRRVGSIAWSPCGVSVTVEEPGLLLWYLALPWYRVTDSLAFFENRTSGGPVLPSWLYPLSSQLLQCLVLRS